MAVHVTETLKDHDARITRCERFCLQCGSKKADVEHYNALSASMAKQQTDFHEKIAAIDKQYAVDIAKIKMESEAARGEAMAEARRRTFWISLISSMVTSIVVGVAVFAITKAVWS